MVPGAWLKWVLVTAALAAAGISAFSDELAGLAWHRYRNAPLALAIPHRNAGLASEIGNFYFGVGGYDLALATRAYRKAVAIDPKIFWGHYQLARIHFMRREYESALSEIALELEANPQNLRSLYVRGLIHGFGGNLALAEEDFQRFTQWAPKEWAGYSDLAWILLKRGKSREAADAIATAFREVPDAGENPWLWNSLGVARLNLREYQRAKIAFVKAQELVAGLSEQDWRRAYPGNNPTDAAGGLKAFRGAITENIRMSQR